MGYVIGFVAAFFLTAVFPPFLMVVIGALAGIGLAKVLVSTLGICSRFARVIDHTPNRIIIPVCFTGPLWVAGFLYLVLHG